MNIVRSIKIIISQMLLYASGEGGGGGGGLRRNVSIFFELSGTNSESSANW